MTQTSLWQNQQSSANYAELCNALYERELAVLSANDALSLHAIQGRLKSLAYYVQRTANLMTHIESPLALDIQNATWSVKQANKMPLSGQEREDVWLWYQKFDFSPGLVIPIALNEHIVLDSIDRVDLEQQRFRGNRYGWFDQERILSSEQEFLLLKPNKRTMQAACAGHCWQNNSKVQPILPTLRELLISCAINWRNFRKPLAVNL